MEFANGTVKKYSREYTRTLKNGKKKKYKTEQVQVTVPKAENIFEDTEEVILLRKDDFADIEDNDELIAALQLCNVLLTEKNQVLNSKLNNCEKTITEINLQLEEVDSKEDLEKLQSELDSKDVIIGDLREKVTSFDDDFGKLQSELDSKDLVIDDLKEKVTCFEEELESKQLLISDLQEELAKLNNELNSLPKEVEFNENFSNNDYLELQAEFIKLSKKFEIVQEDLFNAKVSALYHRNLANKCKKFILKLE